MTQWTQTISDLMEEDRKPYFRQLRGNEAPVSIHPRRSQCPDACVLSVATLQRFVHSPSGNAVATRDFGDG